MKIVEERLYMRKDRPASGIGSEIAMLVSVADDGRMYAAASWPDPKGFLDDLALWESTEDWELVDSKLREPGDHDPIC